MKKIFTLIAAALMAVNVSAANKVLKITGTADKVNAWDSQCFINLKNLVKGKPYVVKFDVYTQLVPNSKSEQRLLTRLRQSI
ncbi:MAG: hypothetical protein U0K51_15815 [Segatella copri]|nr:hypothetical protein [Segatella copri]